jgi:mannose-6-phosphate isomerase-like protein (cupin superfamily)
MQTLETMELVRDAGQGHTVTLRGASVTRKADSAETQGAWSLLEYVAPPHFEGPALHWHAKTTEAFYVLDGTVSFVIGEQTITAGPGAFVRIPTGVAHTFFNAIAAPVRFLTFCTPGGFEQYFDDLAVLITQNGAAPAIGALEALWERYDIHHEPAPGQDVS